MGHRERIYKITRYPAPSPPSPNAVVPELTIELRVNYPHGTPAIWVEERVNLLVEQAMQELWHRDMERAGRAP